MEFKKLENLESNQVVDSLPDKKKEFKKLQPEKEDIVFGDYHISPKGVIYKQGNIVCKVGRSGFYLIQSLRRTNGAKSLGAKDFKPINKNARFHWSTMRKNKRTIIDNCGEIISTNNEDNYFWSHRDD